MVSESIVGGQAVFSTTTDVDGNQIITPDLAVGTGRFKETIVNLMGKVGIESETIVVQRATYDRIQTVIFHTTKRNILDDCLHWRLI